MRCGVALLIGGLLSGAAQASSILELAPSSSDPSIVTLGASAASPSIVAAGTADNAASPSIVALGGEAGVAYENVAAIGNDTQKTSRRPNTAPMVIRGGIVGEAFARDTGSAQPSPAAAPSAGAPAAAQAAAGPSEESDEPAQKLE